MNKKDIEFMKSYFKTNNNSDCDKGQAPLKVHNNIGRKDYSYKKQRGRIRDFMPKEKVGEVIERVYDSNCQEDSSGEWLGK